MEPPRSARAGGTPRAGIGIRYRLAGNPRRPAEPARQRHLPARGIIAAADRTAAAEGFARTPARHCAERRMDGCIDRLRARATGGAVANAGAGQVSACRACCGEWRAGTARHRRFDRRHRAWRTGQHRYQCRRFSLADAVSEVRGNGAPQGKYLLEANRCGVADCLARLGDQDARRRRPRTNSMASAQR